MINRMSPQRINTRYICSMKLRNIVIKKGSIKNFILGHIYLRRNRKL